MIREVCILMCKMGLYLYGRHLLVKWGMHCHSLGLSMYMKRKGTLTSGIHASCSSQ